MKHNIDKMSHIRKGENGEVTEPEKWIRKILREKIIRMLQISLYTILNYGIIFLSLHLDITKG